jgi:hypothetical protein
VITENAQDGEAANPIKLRNSGSGLWALHGLKGK